MGLVNFLLRETFWSRRMFLKDQSNFSRSRWKFQDLGVNFLWLWGRFLILSFFAFVKLFIFVVLFKLFEDQGTFYWLCFLAFGYIFKDLNCSLFWRQWWHFSLIKHPFRRSPQAFWSYFFFCAINFHDQFLFWLFNFFEGAFSPIFFIIRKTP